ncbi:MAG TPA: ABC transporter permease [Blastocatellia bacterium]|nr:ABC transporter permease [Blastocatellia bacterium]
MRLQHWFYTLPLRLRSLLRHRQVEQELDEELRYHLDRQIEENLARGMNAQEARYAALRAMGGMEQHKEACRDMRRVNLIQDFLQDLRYGLRVLARSTTFTAVAVLTLALGIGATTAVFSVIYGVLLRPLPYKEPERIITIWEPSRGGHTLGLTDVEFFDIRDRNQVFEEVAAYATGATNFTGAGEPERVTATWVSADFFPVLGVQPVLGRVLMAEDDKPDPARVVVLSYGLWQRRFGADQGVIGRQVSLNGNSRTVIGVMPRGFQFVSPEVEMWLPLGLDPANVEPGSRSYDAIGRLRPGVTLTQARVELNGIAAQLAVEYKTRFPKGANATSSLNLIPLQELIVGDVRPALLLLLVSTAFVLIIACANVANLQLARGEARQKEMALRLALGANRLRVVRQLLTESLILSVLGGVMGLLLAYWGVGALLALAPASLPRTGEIGINSTVLLFTLAVSLMAGIVFGLAPGRRLSNPDLHAALKEGGRATAGNSGRRTRHLLVISELALAVVLLAGAGLTIRSFIRLLNVDPGFDPRNVLTARISLPQSKYPQPQQVNAFYKQLLERVGTASGVEAAGTATVLPLSGLNSNASFEIEGRPRASDAVAQNADYRMVSSDYFRAMGIPLLQGRYFEASDQEGAPGVVIINESMKHEFWPDEEALGKRINMGAPGSPWLTIIGIIKDVKHKALDATSKPELYFLHSQNADKALGVYRSMMLAVRGTGDPLALTGVVKSAVQAIDKDVPVARVETMGSALSTSVAQPRFTMLLLAIFAGAALALAAVGIYGLMAYSVGQRKHEIGIRMALGAQGGDVVRLIVGQGLGMAVIGIGVGLGLALALTRVMSGLLFEISTTDTLTFVVIALLPLAVALAASLVPAWRALKVDPMTALRYE